MAYTAARRRALILGMVDLLHHDVSFAEALRRLRLSRTAVYHWMELGRAGDPVVSDLVGEIEPYVSRYRRHDVGIDAVLGAVRSGHARTGAPTTTRDVSVSLKQDVRSCRRVLAELEQTGLVERIGERGGWLPNAPEIGG